MLMGNYNVVVHFWLRYNTSENLALNLLAATTSMTCESHLQLLVIYRKKCMPKVWKVWAFFHLAKVSEKPTLAGKVFVDNVIGPIDLTESHPG